MENRATSRQLAHSGAIDGLRTELGDWAVGPGPLFRQLARAIASGVERGTLPRGGALPSERALAAALSVSRGTAVAAYDLLVAEGLVQRRPGSGTSVAGSGSFELPSGREGSALVHRLVDHSAGRSGVVDLSISVLREAAGLPDVAVRTEDLRALRPDTGYSPWGLPELRDAIARHVTGWGLPTTAHEVVVTTGAQQAISAAAACWIRPGDTVVVDDPSYPGAVSTFLQAGARLIGLPVGPGGVRPEDLQGALASHPALVYLQSTLHSPTGTVLGEARRRELAAVIARSRVPLVEDLALADLAWREAPPPIASFCLGASVVVVGSLSKLYWGGLRVGWARADEPLALRIARVKATHDLGSSVLGQAFAARLLAAAPPADMARRRQGALAERYELLAAALRAQLPRWSWEEPEGGMSLWVRLPSPTAEPFAEVALRHGVAVATAPALSTSGRHADRLRLSFSGAPEELAEGVFRLAAAWQAHVG